MDDDKSGALRAPWRGTGAQIRWQNERVLSVADQMFCVRGLCGAQAGQISFKAGNERFLEPSDRPQRQGQSALEA